MKQFLKDVYEAFYKGLNEYRYRRYCTKRRNRMKNLDNLPF